MDQEDQDTVTMPCSTEFPGLDSASYIKFVIQKNNTYHAQYPYIVCSVIVDHCV